MALLRHPIQRKISHMIGADVSFEHLNVSLLGGSLDARGMRVVTGDDGGAEPLLTVDRIRAELSLSRAIRGEIVIKSLTVDRPVLSLVRGPDGSLNLPKPLDDDAPADTATPPAPHGTSDAAAKPSRSTVEIDKVLLVDGEVRFRQGDYRAAASGILLDLSRASGGFDVTMIAETVSRQDRPAHFGTVRATGRLDGTDDVTALANASLDLRLDLGEHLHAHATSAALNRAAGQATVNGSIDLGQLVGLLPVGILPALLGSLSGQVLIDLKAMFDREAGLRVPTCSLKATDVIAPPS